jgi:hypothetical protein
MNGGADRLHEDPDRPAASGFDPEAHVSAIGYARMDTAVSCLLTRFRVRSPWWLLRFYLGFRRVRRASRGVNGLLRALFLVEDFRTCYTLSLWANDAAILDFGSLPDHVHTANSAFGPTWRADLKRAEIWSAQFRLWAVSCHNMTWDGLDLETVLGDQWRRRQLANEWMWGGRTAHRHD